MSQKELNELIKQMEKFALHYCKEGLTNPVCMEKWKMAIHQVEFIRNISQWEFMD